jgi:type II secretory pathway predicted ATPase ExeA
MGKKNKRQDNPEPVEPSPQAKDELLEPERFDPALLEQPAALLQDYFEREVIIEHPHLDKALDAILDAICSPGDGPSLNRLGIMVLVIGPSRVGKTTLIEKLVERLLERAIERMLLDPAFISHVLIDPPGKGRFNWMYYIKAVLRQLGDPFIDRRTPALRTRDYEEAMEEAFIQRKPFAVIVDEAQHLAKAASGPSLQSQLDQLKYYENRTGVSHVLVGTYEMRPFRKANAQLAGRSIDVHFPRYDATKPEDRAIFRSVLWALQRQLPVEEEPLLMQDHWEFLYARSIGCIGLLKLHLNRALNRALTEGAKTVTEEHLRMTAPAEDRVNLWLNTAIRGEEELTEREGADERLLVALGLREPKGVQQADESTATQVKGGSHSKRGRKPGDRNPGRDPIDDTVDDLEDTLEEDANGERVAG